MRICIEDWEFDVDISTTMSYSAQEAAEHCTCAYCRNFYAAVDGRYPQLRPFLAQFGLDIEAPDELIPYEPTHLVAYYAVSGQILCKGAAPVSVGKLNVFPESSDDAAVNTFLAGSCFFLRTEMFRLPWLLEEPMEDVVSPVNDPSFQENVMKRFLGLFGKNSFRS